MMRQKLQLPSFRGLSHFPRPFPKHSNKETDKESMLLSLLLSRPEKVSPEISAPDLNPITTSFGHKRNGHDERNSTAHRILPPTPSFLTLPFFLARTSYTEQNVKSSKIICSTLIFRTIFVKNLSKGMFYCLPKTFLQSHISL